MSFVRDFFVATGLMRLGLFALGRKQESDLEALYKTYADARGISVEEARIELASAERDLAAQEARQAVETAQRKADAREEQKRAQELQERMKVWGQGAGREAHR